MKRFDIESYSDFSAKLSNFRRLVLGCMDSYDSNHIVNFAAFFEIYKIYILLHRSDLKISAKNAFKILLE